jgi:hypothetical protein
LVAHYGSQIFHTTLAPENPSKLISQLSQPDHLQVLKSTVQDSSGVIKTEPVVCTSMMNAFAFQTYKMLVIASF